MKKIFVTCATALCMMVTQAGGFRVNLQGVKQLAMAHTSAHAEDASVAFFNPAGISFLPTKLSIATGGFLAKNNISYQNLNTGESFSTENPFGTPFYAAFAYKIRNYISAGVSVTTPFGSRVKWPKKWAGSELVEKMELQSFFIQPTISFRLSDWVSLGGSYIYAKGSVNWDRSIQNLDGEINIKDNKAHGQGFSLGFYFQPNNLWDISVAYRSPVDMHADQGKVTFNVSPNLFSALKLNSNGEDNFKATLPLVDEYILGLSYKITPKWMVSADFNYSGWSRYTTLILDLENAPLDKNASDATVLKTPKNFKDSQTWRFGTQYTFNNLIVGRLGYYYDESPYSDDNFVPETPSFNSNVFTAGIGFKLKELDVDFSGALAIPHSRNIENSHQQFFGQAKAIAYYLGLGISYHPF